MPRAAHLALFALATVLLAAEPVAAHPRGRVPIVFTPPALSETISAAAAEPALPWQAVAALVVAAVVGAWRPRRAVAGAVVLVLGVLAFEAGVHSTHHLGQAGQSAQCVMAGISAQLTADLVDTTLVARPLALPHGDIAASRTAVIDTRTVAPDAGRAPPVLPA